ncbi:MAG: response regulator [Candidatus Fibromonas sp.]|jgi:response regulator NasT|nr:response regulator [Candidatus Fibromonas sp.]
MENALIVSCMEKGTALFMQMLNAASIRQITTLQSCAEARSVIMGRDFDLVIVNAPLPDETGESFAQSIASKSLSQVILVAKNEYFYAVSAACEEYGILTISKPINRDIFWSALMLAKAMHNRIKLVQTENLKLKRKIENIRIIDRAKCILISYLKMNEQEAHKYIEKQAMDMRTSRRAVAEGILKTYEN